MEKVLIVDDSPVQAAQLKSILDQEYDVSIVQTAEDGLTEEIPTRIPSLRPTRLPAAKASPSSTVMISSQTSLFRTAGAD